MNRSTHGLGCQLVQILLLLLIILLDTELTFVILRILNPEDADYKASESQGCRF